MTRPRALLLGGHGWLGTATAEAMRRTFDVEAPRRGELNLRDERALRSAVASLRPDVVVNLAAAQPPRTRAEMDEVNVAGAAGAASAAATAGARFVHMSSDVVHDGRGSPYADDAPAAPVHDYGRSKAAGERAVLAAHPSPLLLRTSLVVDPLAPDRFLRGCLERLARGEACLLFEDEIRCPIPRTTLASAVAELAASGTTGHLNVAGTEAISRFDLGTLLLARFGADLSLVRRERGADGPEPRPLDLRLDVSRARSLLRTPLRGIREEVADAPVSGRRS